MITDTTTYEEKQQLRQNEIAIKLLQRLDDRLKNAHYWLTERDAQKQAEEAIMEARGITLRLSEKYGGWIAFPANKEDQERKSPASDCSH
jgi:hypothetical protein